MDVLQMKLSVVILIVFAVLTVTSQQTTGKCTQKTLKLFRLYLLIYLFIYVPAGSLSCGGDDAVYVSDINRPSLPTPDILFLCLFLSLWPFQLYFTPLTLLITLRFLTLFFRSYFCLIGPFNYMSLYERFLQP